MDCTLYDSITKEDPIIRDNVKLWQQHAIDDDQRVQCEKERNIEDTPST